MRPSFRTPLLRRARVLAPWLAVLLLSHAPLVGAVPLDWNNAGGGAAGVAANWNPAQVPAAADNLRFLLAASYNVAFGATVPVSNLLNGIDGTVQLGFVVPHTTANLRAGTVAGLAPSLRISGGTLNAGDGLRVATGAGTSGTLEVSGSSTNVHQLGGAGQVEVGGTGTGTLSVINGGLLSVLGGVRVPQPGGGTGTVIVQGTGTSRRSTLTISENVAAEYLHLGSSGIGEVQVEDGGLLSAMRSVRVGETAGATGTLSLLNGDPVDSARVVIRDDLWIARNDVAAAPAGTGAVTVGNESAMDVGGATWTYDDDAGGLGTLAIEEGGRFATRDLHVGNPATELLLHGGRLQVVGGTLDLTGDPLRVSSGTGTPTVQLIAGATCAINSPTLPALEAGNAAFGRVDVLDNSSLTVHDQIVRLGTSAGGNGTLHIGGGSTLVVDQDVIAGREGYGELVVDGGAQATLGGLNTATHASGSGQVAIDGAGTDVHVLGQFVLSGLAGATSGAASECVVMEGAGLWLDDAVSPGVVWGPGILTVETGGTVHVPAAAILDMKGTLSLQDGNVTGGALKMDGGGDISGWGDVSSSVWSGIDSLSVVTATGPLQLGDASQPLGYVMRGLLGIGANTVTLRDADFAETGTLLLAGGTLIGPPGGISLYALNYLRGTGTVQGLFLNRGSIYADGAAGLAFGGLLESTNRPVQGSLIHFLPGGGFWGSGSILAPVRLDAGATMTPYNSLELGTGAAQLMQIDGKIDVAANALAFNTLAAVPVAGEVALGGGVITAPLATTLQIATGGSLTGTGTVTMPVDVTGHLKPGPAAGQLTLLSLAMQPGGTYDVDLGNHALAEGDLVSVSGTATLDGTIEVNLLPTFTGAIGDSFLVLTAASRIGTFANLTLHGAPASGKLVTHYHGNQVWIVIEPGFVDVPDETPGAGAPRALAFASQGSPGRAPVFELALPEASDVTVDVFDVAGRRMARLAEGTLPAGVHRLALARGLEGAGVLYARAEVAGVKQRRTLVAKAVVLK